MNRRESQTTDLRVSPVQPHSPAAAGRFGISPATFRLSTLPRTVIALGLVSLFNDASSEIIYPLLPLFLTTTLGASIAAVGLIEGVTESTASLLKLFAGWFSDRLGHRKSLVVAGYGTAALTRPLLALAASAWQVLGLRFIDRVGKGLRSAPRDAMIADAAPENQRGMAFGFHRAMDHSGAIAGSLAGAGLVWLFQNDYRRVFYAATIPALVSVLILIFAVREAPREADTSAAQSAPLPHPLSQWSDFNPEFKKFLGVLLLFTLTSSSDAFLLLRAQQSGISAVMIPVLWAVLHASKVLSSLAGGGLSDRLGRRPLIISGWLLYAAIYGGFAMFSSRAAMWTLFAIYGIYFGLTEGVEKALVADLVARRQRGTAFGLYNLVIGITALPASVALGLLWQRFGAETALISSALVSLLAAALLLTVKARREAEAGG